MSRPTVHDVAARAGVSLATVDRVLNKRGGVAAKSVKLVDEAVNELGYVRDARAANLSRARQDRLLFIMHDGARGFVGQLRQAVADRKADFLSERVIIEERSSPPFDVKKQVALLREVDPADWDALAVMVSDTSEIHAELERLRAAGLPVIALIAQLSPAARDGYVGIDNVQAGRTAGYLAGRLAHAPGRVLMIAGSLSARDHAERVVGFRAVIESQFTHLSLLPALQGSDSIEENTAMVKRALTDPDLAVLYNCGDGNAGIVAALEGRARRPVTIVHELTQSTRRGLQVGAIDLVIDQDPEAEISRVIALMRRLIDQGTLAEQDGLLRPRLYLKENL